MAKVHDADLGSMDFDGSRWVLERLVHFNGVDIPVHIEHEDVHVDIPSPVQRQAALLALTLPPDTLDKAAPAVVQNYEVYREMIGDEDMPPLQKPSDVWQEVQPSYIEVPAHDGLAVPTFLLYAECSWDPEHGLAVRFRNGYADASNQQGEIGLED